MLKRIVIALLVASALAITLASCGGNENETTADTENQTVVTTKNPMEGEFVETDELLGEEAPLPEE